MLTAAQIAARDGKVTASFLPALMAGDEAKILSEWRRLVGDPSWEPEDLSDKWPVEFGSYIESFALDWHQRKTGHALTRRGEVVRHPTQDHMCCTLDAWRADDATVLDCKAPGQWRKLDDVLAYYVPQMVMQRACTGAAHAALLVVHGGSEPVEHPITWDDDYEAAVWTRVAEFWRCVETLTPPVAMDAIAAVPPEQWRRFDLDAMQAAGEAWPNWAHAMHPDLGSWAETCAAAKRNAKAAKSIKELLPDDVDHLTCEGVVVSRAKNGAVSIKEAKAS